MRTSSDFLYELLERIQENVITVVGKRKTLLSMPMAVQNACLKINEGDVWGWYILPRKPWMFLKFSIMA